MCWQIRALFSLFRGDRDAGIDHLAANSFQALSVLAEIRMAYARRRSHVDLIVLALEQELDVVGETERTNGDEQTGTNKRGRTNGDIYGRLPPVKPVFSLFRLIRAKRT